MILKDNDCGFKGFAATNERLIDGIRHLSKETYTQFMRFAQEINTQTTYEYFTRALAFPENDFLDFRERVEAAAYEFETRCRSGELKTDLNIAAIFEGRNSGSLLSCDY